ncbi:MAG: hypothetical protein ACTHKB_13535, partial [Burkholderiaceae bacterium]
MDTSLPLAAATALVNLSLAWIVGLAAARFWLARDGMAASPLDSRLARAMTATMAACFLGVALFLWSEAAAMADVEWSDAGSAFVTVLRSTHVGHAGIAAFAALAAAWYASRFDGRVWPVGPAVGAAMIALFAVARAAASHAADAGIVSVAVGVEWLHLVLIAFWVGAVCVAGWLVLPAWHGEDAPPDATLARYLHTLSDWAAVALIGILVTGT